ncbi:MAG: PEP-CTERM sorting domain-containing protein, partial [Parvularculaceae bacterium]|nr:PEP-CTERM sorting domain-containing protein [Parvularculaceae bacterium]
ASREATLLGEFANRFGQIRGLAIAPGDAPEVPLPAAAFAFMTGGAGLAFLRRRRQVKAPALTS